MPKSNPLAQGLVKHAQRPARPAKPEPEPKKSARDGRVLIAGFFAPKVRDQLKILAVKEHTTTQALLAESLNMLFASRHEPEIADITS
jgi:hypothetical protein